MDPSTILLAVMAIAISIPAIIIGVPLSIQFAHGVSANMSINAANAAEEVSKTSRQ